MVKTVSSVNDLLRQHTEDSYPKRLLSFPIIGHWLSLAKVEAHSRAQPAPPASASAKQHPVTTVTWPSSPLSNSSQDSSSCRPMISYQPPHSPPLFTPSKHSCGFALSSVAQIKCHAFHKTFPDSTPQWAPSSNPNKHRVASCQPALCLTDGDTSVCLTQALATTYTLQRQENNQSSLHLPPPPLGHVHWPSQFLQMFMDIV